MLARSSIEAWTLEAPNWILGCPGTWHVIAKGYSTIHAPRETGQERSMAEDISRLRVLYSFPHKLGADRICYTAWQQVNGLAAAGVDLLVFPGALQRPVPEGVKTKPTLARGRLRVPYRLFGSGRAFA